MARYEYEPDLASPETRASVEARGLPYRFMGRTVRIRPAREVEDIGDASQRGQRSYSVTEYLFRQDFSGKAVAVPFERKLEAGPRSVEVPPGMSVVESGTVTYLHPTDKIDDYFELQQDGTYRAFEVWLVAPHPDGQGDLRMRVYPPDVERHHMGRLGPIERVSPEEMADAKPEPVRIPGAAPLTPSAAANVVAYEKPANGGQGTPGDRTQPQGRG